MRRSSHLTLAYLRGLSGHATIMQIVAAATGERQDDPPPRAPASARSPAPRLTSAKPPASSPRTPTINAMIDSTDEPPAPSELFDSIVGAGVSEDSGPAQLTIDPSE